MKRDIYQDITNKVLSALGDGIRPWFKPWNAEHAAGVISRPLKHDFMPYGGINILNLWICADDKGYSAPIWMTFNQAKNLGGRVLKGEKASLSIMAKTYQKYSIDKNTGDKIERDITFSKGYSVFNVDQIEGLPKKYYGLARELAIKPEDRINAIEKFFFNTGANIREGGSKAYYARAYDRVQMPEFTAYDSVEDYYSSLAHEMIHWTRHSSRLNRDLGGKIFGDDGYAMEELVAELGSAYLSADLGLAADVRAENISYIDHWFKVLEKDKKAIFTAAAHAQRAIALLYSYQGDFQHDFVP